MRRAGSHRMLLVRSLYNRGIITTTDGSVWNNSMQHVYSWGYKYTTLQLAAGRLGNKAVTAKIVRMINNQTLVGSVNHRVDTHEAQLGK